jgi:hypothetical protein
VSVAATTWAWQQSVKGNAKLVLLALADHCGPDGTCWPGQKHLAEKCSITERSVREQMLSLEKQEMIERTERRRQDGSRTTDLIRLALPEEIRHPTGRKASESARVSSGHESSVGTKSSADAEDDARESNHSEAEAIRRVFVYWQTRCGHPTALLSPERQSKIRARLREGRTAEEFKTAIDGAALAPTVSDNGKRHDDIELICRNAVKFESFVDRAAPTQNNGGGKYGHLVQHC